MQVAALAAPMLGKALGAVEGRGDVGVRAVTEHCLPELPLGVALPAWAKPPVSLQLCACGRS